MVVGYELGGGVTRCVFIVSSAIFSVVSISFLQKEINLKQDSVTISSGDGREAVNLRRTWVRLSFVEALSSQSLSSFQLSAGLSISSISGMCLSQHPRCIGASA
jgi:hypothetical protein